MLSLGPIAWYSKKQPTTALSTTEAEYSAITQATRQAIWSEISWLKLALDLTPPHWFIQITRVLLSFLMTLSFMHGQNTLILKSFR